LDIDNCKCYVSRQPHQIGVHGLQDRELPFKQEQEDSEGAFGDEKILQTVPQARRP
jgi:hypothetical protein